MGQIDYVVGGTGLLAVVLAVLLAGCAAGPPPVSGFLGDYSGFQADPKDKSLLYYEAPGIDWGKYTKLMIDPVMVYYHPKAKHRGIRPEELKTLTDEFRRLAIEAVKDAYPVVDGPGPDVLRVRAAITNLVPADPLLNAATTAAIGVPVDIGKAAMEAEFLDSVTGRRLAAVIDRKSGSVVRVWQGFTRWSHVRHAFKQWAKELRRALDEAHGRK